VEGAVGAGTHGCHPCCRASPLPSTPRSVPRPRGCHARLLQGSAEALPLQRAPSPSR